MKACSNTSKLPVKRAWAAIGHTHPLDPSTATTGEASFARQFDCVAEEGNS